MKLFVGFLSLFFSICGTAFAVPAGFTHINYSCKMACGQLSIGGGNCRGLQVSGEMSQDSTGQWSGGHSEFAFSPDKFEYFSGLQSGCVADFTAKINLISVGVIYISFGEATYHVPQKCGGGSVLTGPVSTVIPAFTLFAHQNSTGKFSATASVPRKTSWPAQDAYPECEISFQ